ncbi:hypothetical protein [Saccharothrix sp. ALI-22-I]|uniref:hypothetical protein n=1 Tax=Saccharothrix sp. ALI-22-I TaxID=1933778 RepID=UPI00117A951F|nr:hypothetical protein [Saccharothrix sp. ALI-22-I]
MTSPVPLATVADVQDCTEVRLIPEQQARAAVLPADASALARARVPDLPNPPPDTAPGVIFTVVLRALTAPPDGNRSETVGGHSRVAAHEGGALPHRRRTRPAPATDAGTMWRVFDMDSVTRESLPGLYRPARHTARMEA